MTTLRRLTSLLAVMAMLLTFTAIPAFAVAEGTATVTSGDLFSGKGGLVTVNIENDASGGIAAGIGAGSAIDAFTIEVPQDLVDVAATDVTLPSGWQGGYDSEIGIIFAEATDGSELPPGESLNVDIGVTADPQADDLTRPFTTHVSDDGGLTLHSAGSPQVTSRILELTRTWVVKPATATNADRSQVTAGQDTAYVAVTVTNHGSETRQVTFDVAAIDGNSSLTETNPKNSWLTPGATKTPGIWVTFGDPGSLTIQGVATTDNSAANPGEDVATADLTVQAAFAASLVADSLEPEAGVQGSTEDISYRIDKTAGAQPVDATATLSFDGTTFEVSQDQFFDAPNGEKNVTFDDVVIPDEDNGTYSTSSAIDGVDANGATVDLDLNPGDFILDNLLPVVNITATPEANDIENTAPASSDGRTVFFEGSIGLSSGSGQCTNCSVTKAVFIAQPSGTEFPIQLNNAGGDLSGSGEFDYPDGTTSAVAEVTAVRNETGSSDTETSNTVTVDLELPVLDGPGSTFRHEDADQIVVPLFDDGIFVDTTNSNPLDWSVDNNTVVAIEGRPEPGRATEVVLTLRSRLDDNATPTVTYSPPLTTPRMHDRVSLEVLDQVINTVDGIIPDAPVIATVNGLGLQDGEFWINDSTPEVGLTDLVPGNTLQIFFDTDGNGAPDDGESVYNNTINNESETVTLADLGSVEVSHKLMARMKDSSGNIGVLDEEVLNLDFTAAQIIDFSVAGQEVTVQFDEPVTRGRNAAFDWTVLATQNGVQAHRTVTSVTVGANDAQRVLTISEASFDASAGGTVDGVRYKFRGLEPADRYEDRATNLFADVLFTKP